MIDLGNIKKVHMIGIGGAGMSALAHALHDRSIQVTGSDIHDGEQVAKLRSLGIAVTIGHADTNIDAPELVVYTSAIKPHNAELQMARKLGIPVIHRSELLASFIAAKRAIAVAGTHGKTTTTAMLGKILVDADCDPTVLIGGKSLDFDDNYRLGASELVVFEADESDASFHKYRSCSHIVTNVEAEHLDKHHDLATVCQVFADFIKLGDPNGFLIYGADCPQLSSLFHHCPGIARGFSIKDTDAYYRATDITTNHCSSTARIHVAGRLQGTLMLSTPGRHNVANALAALGMAHCLDIPVATSLQSLAGFSGIARRFQLIYSSGKLRIYDDYAHHPTEVRETLDTARAAYPDAHITVIFQPHLPSRTRIFLDAFAHAFSKADAVIVNSIYAAREDPIPGFTGQQLADRISECEPTKPVRYFPDQDLLREYLLHRIADEELLIFIGAGDINEVSRALVAQLQAAKD
jgi:UDP-N-acetylmuramate--alanine ligase